VVERESGRESGRERETEIGIACFKSSDLYLNVVHFFNASVD
jgi:hypothetical protein